ncbi:hypothetical protein [Pseudomonas sp. CFBP 13719]|uniref:hypothetical protein n=1 Tax=Pseudomonas sp. CFBP 13719 TaxID=2775303 RepID=UPI0017862ECF|nr:hypothetical protein [Pseudomonas sp. CFBP 13719]MBD8685025.1 hypothetical protein [Pseudomonas sp. CFBP 13719]
MKRPKHRDLLQGGLNGLVERRRVMQMNAQADARRAECASRVNRPLSAKTKQPGRSAPGICTYSKARHFGGPFSQMEHTMQSHNYVPGVSGWKMHKGGRLEVGGVIRVVLSEGAQAPQPDPFVVIDGVTYIPKAEVRNAKMGVTLKVLDGKYVAAGFNIGVADIKSAQIPKPKSVDLVLKEMSERTASDYAIAARIGAVEARLNNPAHLNEIVRKALEPGGLIYKAFRAAR